MAARTDAGWPDWGEPENIRHPATAVNRGGPLSAVQTVGYGASQRDDALELLFLGEIRRGEQHGGGGPDGLGGGPGGAHHEGLRLPRDRGIRRASAAAVQ